MNTNRGGFALPTVLIASVVMLTILAVSVSSVATVRIALKEQYYEQLAKAAGEAGVAYAKACLAQSGNVPLWTDAKPLTPATDCAGNEVLSPALEVLVVGGGGGGGGNYGGGGGGGGVVADSSFLVTPKQYNTRAGSGGAGGSNAASGSAGTNGGNSWILPVDGVGPSITAIGGGGGGSHSTTTGTAVSAKVGGSGGGGAGSLSGGLPATGADGTVNQGSAGGSGSAGSSTGNGGGGGGAGGPGGAATGTASGEGVSGNGGPGQLSHILGSANYYGAGGSGGRWGTGQVGLPGRVNGGIGGNADGIAGSAGATNFGAGGGGGGAGAAGGNGGSGTVAIRTLKPGTPGANIALSITGSYATVDNGIYRTYRLVGSGSFTVTSATSGTCPSDPRCSVFAEQNLRSSFSIKRPTMNSEGKAVAIPNTGYVELLRTSSGAVWRTYRQPSVQPAVVPDFCSAAAQNGLGWAYAVKTTPQQTIPGPSGIGAASISFDDDLTYPGQAYYRKDFAVTTPGIYTLRASTPSDTDTAEFYINGNPIAKAEGSLVTGTANLGVGCYTIMVRTTNKSIAFSETNFIASLALQNASPLVVTDESWRVSRGVSTHFSSGDYYASPDVWTSVTPAYGSASASEATRGGYAAETTRSGWDAATGDPYAYTLAGCSGTNGSTSQCTADRWSYFRANEDFVLTSETDVTLSAFCTKSCDFYLGGNTVLKANDNNLQQQTFTLAPGVYRLAARVYHGTGTSPASHLGFSLKNSSGTILARSDYSWQVSNNQYDTTSAIEPYSYEASFAPSPNVFPPTFDAVVVGGGGGGGSNSAGGGGGGGVLSIKGIEANVSNRTVTLGVGGAGAPNASSIGTSGGSTVFGPYTALGGGGGASRDGGPAPSAGATGGGGSGTTASGSGIRNVGALGTLGMGWAGGYGTPADQGVGSKGGGGGGATGQGAAATTTVAGRGGSGYIMYVNNGTRRALAGGGGGGVTASNGTPGSATDGGANGSIGTPAAAVANSGGGGGGGGSPGSAGGSGTVIIRYRTALFAAAKLSAVGGTKVVDTITGYTYHIFTGNGGFVISQIP